MVEPKLVSTESEADKIVAWTRSTELLGPYQRPWSWSANDVLDRNRFQVYILICMGEEVGFSYLLFKRFSRVEIGVTLFPPYRNRGIGAMAHRHLIDISTGKYNYAEALTMKENLAERKILLQAGFHLVDQLYISDVLVYKFRKILTQSFCTPYQAH